MSFISGLGSWFSNSVKQSNWLLYVGLILAVISAAGVSGIHKYMILVSLGIAGAGALFNSLYK